MVRIYASLIAAFMATCAWAQSMPATVAEGMTPPIGTSASAISATPLTLSRAIEHALRANPALSAAAREVEALEGGLIQAGAIPNPELEALVEDTRTTTLQINQPIELGGKRAARIAAAERARDIGTVDLDARRAEVRAAVASAFFEALSAQERLRIARASSELAQRSLDVAARRVLAGKVSPVEETRARVAASAARVEFAQATSESAVARQRLASTWGATRVDFDRIHGAPEALAPAVPLDVLLARLNDAAAVQRLQLEVQRRDALVEVERSRRYPDITLSVGAKRDEEIGRDQVVLGVAVPLPLFDRNRGNVLEALRRADKARDEQAAARAQLVAELINARTRYAALREEVEISRVEILPGAQSAFDAATKGFELGKFDFLDVLDAQRTLFQAQSQYFRALAEAHRSAADIDRVLGEHVASTQP